ncbi:hypothetical protein ABL78_1446 [Leptomonas seymouri]|uniref:Uncharacterized protein n=1 Tax=Leptomonas seymouri TaxID=5684 RepID=A0A0N1I0L5_LEPSE|nr:hypothetical protein ABL78_1446 [Leptomonas seymouri]|eukprot:KPI89410.1 hypothetical protein ABL78_1446 [Leptomonas seymouri]
MSQSLATYPLVQCVVSSAQFASGEVSFYDSYAELTAVDAEGSCTSPLRIDYDLLEHFRIVRAQRVMRLTLPQATVRQWAKRNGFASQLDAFEGVQEANGDIKNAGLSCATAAVLLLQLKSEGMSDFLQTIAPLVSASRRTRSASRISVTEPLPLYSTVIDPAPDVELEMRAGSRCSSATAMATPSQSMHAEVMHAEHQRSERHGGKHTLSELPRVSVGGAQMSTADPPSAIPLSARLDAERALLGDESHNNESQMGASDSGAAHKLQQVGAPLKSVYSANAATPQSAQPAPLPAAQHVLLDTLNSVEEELAGLLEDTDGLQMYPPAEGGRGQHLAQPLRRPDPVLPAALLSSDTRQKNNRCGRGGRGLPHGGFTAVSKRNAPSLCPSLMSSATDGHAEPRPTLKCGGGADPLSAARRTEETIRKGKTNRLVITHLCASEKGSSVSAKAPAAAEENFAETVATVTLQSGKIRKIEAESRLENPFHVEVQQQDGAQLHATPDKEAAAAEKVACSVKEASTYGNALQHRHNTSHASLGKVPRAHQKPRPSKLNRSLSPTSSSVRVGDFLIHDDAPLPAEKSDRATLVPPAVEPSTHAAALYAKNAAAHEGTATQAEAHLPVNVSQNDKAACSRKLPVERPLDAEVRRDVKSYLLDLFSSPGAPARQRSRIAAKPSTAATTTMPGVPCRRGRLPKAKIVDPAPQRAPAQKKQTDAAAANKQGRRGCRNSDVAVASEKTWTLQVRTSPKPHQITPRKRSRSKSSNTGEDPLRRPPTHRSDSVEALLPGHAAQAKPKAAQFFVSGDETFHSGNARFSTVCDAEVLEHLQVPSPLIEGPSSRRPSNGQQRTLDTTKGDGCEAAKSRCCKVKGPKRSILLSDEEREAAATRSSEDEDTDAAAETLPKASRHQTSDRAHASACKAGALRCASVEQQRFHFQPDGLSCARQRWGSSFVGTPQEATAAACQDVESTSSKATCPLLYHRDSRKERTRRLLRYMNVVSQNLAVIHETHDELRGLLLAMVSDSQL